MTRNDYILHSIKQGVNIVDQVQNPTAHPDDFTSFQNWYFQQTVELGHLRQEIEDERKNVEQARSEVERQQQQLQREQNLFDMKFHLLEEELRKLADDKTKFERQRDFYTRIHEYEEGKTPKVDSQMLEHAMFFRGITKEKALRKRYKDLIKIYHPDNQYGDTEIIQEINREYDELLSQMT